MGTAGRGPPFSSSEASRSSAKQKAGFPSHPFRGGTKFFKGPILDLPDALLADPKEVADLPEAVSSIASEAETKVQNLLLTGTQVVHEKIQGFLPFRILPQGRAFVVWHGLS